MTCSFKDILYVIILLRLNAHASMHNGLVLFCWTGLTRKLMAPCAATYPKALNTVFATTAFGPPTAPPAQPYLWCLAVPPCCTHCHHSACCRHTLHLRCDAPATYPAHHLLITNDSEASHRVATATSKATF
jgi:hypothetical protein